ncbi:DEAD/DEAH box helicase [Heliorestis acidaminivorans]|uniref:DEAD/DEAH box helicase n=1 Tax=Heliorestis acidaminivorans TaxID=553427 RepID=A0A6I0EW08_9FIRM|nr:SNF2-related protein [Heliorestis acidaminivorans]KAB2952158.1 DEAD/DEAH box helicase [Heliorestis acidaminivorans]
MSTKYHAKYYATELSLQRASDSIENLTSSLSNAKVDLNPHQIDAALFALKSPIANGVLLADEVGLGKTIEAGIVISQKWAERKRRILLILPSSLRKQWHQELLEKFFINSIVLESKSYNEMKRKGFLNPFDIKNNAVICSYHFASKKKDEIKKVKWDMVVIDEAHRLRNVYKPSNKIANNIKEAIQPYPKLLLTATPLQNSLMELYGLVSIIDKYAFGDKKTFSEQYIRNGSEEIRNHLLKKRLAPFCKRTLRKQVTEYVPYTNRISLVQEYYPTNQEWQLYENVSSYLRKDRLFALPVRQRHLMTLILRKLLSSSSFAITSTLESLLQRLDDLLEAKETKNDIDNTLYEEYDTLEELQDEWDEDEQTSEEYVISDPEVRKLIEDEKKELLSYIELAKSIEKNTKGNHLLTALKEGFKYGQQQGALEKAVIFTESRRTQEYLYELLVNNGYENEVVLINGSNSDKQSKEIYNTWTDNNKNSESITGSRTADMKAAIVEEFRNSAKILIATEAAAEGINLQFCSLVVNYDLPWNPQRIEQRIGRCHRYGQKNDVVVINFVNKRNEADQKVYELLSAKFKLFDGIFGASDEVLGSLESGVDFEKRIAAIYQNCRTTEEIQQAFSQMQAELEEEIDKTLKQAKVNLLENFDEEVHEKLKIQKERTDENLSRYQEWMLKLAQAELGNEIKITNDRTRFFYNGNLFQKGYYDFNWKRAEQSKSIFFRSDGQLINSLIEKALNRDLPIGVLELDYSNYKPQKGKITFLENLSSKSGWLSVDKLTVESFEKEERLLFYAVTDAGEVIDEELSNKLLDFDGYEQESEMINHLYPEKMIENRKKELVQKHKTEIDAKNAKYFDEEIEKLEAWADDLKDGLEKEIKELDAQIKLLKKDARNCTSFEEKLQMQKQIKELEKKRNNKRRSLYEEQDQIDEQKEELIFSMEEKIKKKETISNVLCIRWRLN